MPPCRQRQGRCHRWTIVGSMPLRARWHPAGTGGGCWVGCSAWGASRHRCDRFGYRGCSPSDAHAETHSVPWNTDLGRIGLCLPQWRYGLRLRLLSSRSAMLRWRLLLRNLLWRRALLPMGELVRLQRIVLLGRHRLLRVRGCVPGAACCAGIPFDPGTQFCCGDTIVAGECCELGGCADGVTCCAGACVDLRVAGNCCDSSHCNTGDLCRPEVCQGNVCVAGASIECPAPIDKCRPRWIVRPGHRRMHRLVRPLRHALFRWQSALHRRRLLHHRPRTDPWRLLRDK